MLLSIVSSLTDYYFRYIDACYDPALISPSDVGSAFNQIAESAHGSIILFEHLLENWNDEPVPPG